MARRGVRAVALGQHVVGAAAHHHQARRGGRGRGRGRRGGRGDGAARRRARVAQLQARAAAAARARHGPGAACAHSLSPRPDGGPPGRGDLREFRGTDYVSFVAKSHFPIRRELRLVSESSFAAKGAPSRRGAFVLQKVHSRNFSVEASANLRPKNLIYENHKRSSQTANERFRLRALRETRNARRELIRIFYRPENEQIKLHYSAGWKRRPSKSIVNRFRAKDAQSEPEGGRGPRLDRGWGRGRGAAPANEVPHSHSSRPRRAWRGQARAPGATRHHQ